MGYKSEKTGSPDNFKSHCMVTIGKEAPGSLFFQPKLRLGRADDIYEREADAVADRIMRKDDEEEIQTKTAPFFVQPKCQHCEEEKEQLKRKATGNGKNESVNTSILTDAMTSAGQIMDQQTASFMEQKFGYSFNNVRIHTDGLAAKSAESIDALAYTSQNDIVFNEGQYSPHTENGRRLLAHELTHVVQQRGTDEKTLRKKDDTRRKEDESADPCTYSRLGTTKREIHLNLSKDAVRVYKNDSAGKYSHTEFNGLITGPSTVSLANKNGWCHMYNVDGKNPGPTSKQKLYNFVGFCGEFGFHSDHWTKNNRKKEKIPGAESHGCARIPDGGDFKKGDSKKFFDMVKEGDCVRLYSRNFWRAPTFAKCSGGDSCKI